MTIDDLIGAPQYSVSSADKQIHFPEFLKAAYRHNAEHSPAFAKFLRASGFVEADATKIADFPPLPVAVFKDFTLRTCTEQEVVRELRSSSTTSQRPSRIFLDKQTLLRGREGARV